MAKLNINLQAGTIEVEGNDELAKKVYEDFKSRLMEQKHTISQVKDAPKDESINKHGETMGKAAAKRTTRGESYSIVSDLELSGKNGKQSLREFYNGKKHDKAFENNTIFVYYLKKITNVEGVNPEHIYTCYKAVNTKVPGALRQSLIDTAARKGWISTRNLDDIQITTIGENAVEHDLVITTELEEK